MPLTVERIKRLTYREVIVDTHGRRWYVTGKVRTWKRDATRYRVPLKHGLYAYSELIPQNLDCFSHVEGEE